MSILAIIILLILGWILLCAGVMSLAALVFALQECGKAMVKAFNYIAGEKDE